MGGHVATEVDHHLIDVAPSPAFRWVIPFHDRMSCSFEMCGRVAEWGLIAAADVTAASAYAQVQPLPDLGEGILRIRARWA